MAASCKARYDAKGNLIAEIDALGYSTEYLNSEDGLPHTIIDATRKSKYLWWNNLAQVERFQDCSGKSTYYRYDERQHLVAVTDALNQTTRLERKPDGEVLRIDHPDGTAESFTYNALGQVLTHTDGKGQTTRLLRTARGLPSSRQDAKGQRIRYEYDKAIRLTALVNKNNAAYAPLARIDQAEGEDQKLYYFHTDQIGTPLEMTDQEGQIVWQATYRAWGEVETLAVSEVEQNLRFQGQYYDDETGLHYNTFRYYDPQVGRFITQDPIGLLGGDNLYGYAPNTNGWIDPLGWCVTTNVTRGAVGQPLRATATITAKDLGTGTATNNSSRVWARLLGKSDDDAGHIIGKLLGGSGGKNGVFPQLSKINRGQFREFEKSLSQYIKANGSVDVDIVSNMRKVYLGPIE